jgi:hypothetical protein
MRFARIVPLVAAVFLGGASVSAQQALAGLPTGRASTAAPELTIPGWVPTVRQAKPVWNLFENPSKPASTSPPLFMTPRLLQRGRQDVRQNPEVVCGMTLIPADPNIDSAIRHAVPESGPTYSIRAVNPPACRR